MSSYNKLDATFAAELESCIQDVDFLYAEQQDSPPYDFLILSVSLHTLKLCERLGFKKTQQHFRLSSNYSGKVASLSAPDVSFVETRKTIFGGTWICIFVINQAPLCCFKIESAAEQDQIAFRSWVNSISTLLKELRIDLKGNWHILHQTESDPLFKTEDPLIVDMHLDPRIRVVANDMGLKFASDFSKVRASDFKAQLSPHIEEQVKMFDELNHELNALRISMIE